MLDIIQLKGKKKFLLLILGLKLDIIRINPFKRNACSFEWK